ncbi:DUF309 domain-containing protein [Bacillus sp. T33-2]|uniref:DUF309 domain-containing protein n=1 Tax=Bacillus sp. T33-2 TaxID=2054168 RepID=UPI000C7948F0|nr:DUF309 domain-containing protein [Bacillus sp. T33-2]PLR99802.1 DUF309 domain-containing protein [Bacillus sp. T33-2]
MYPEAYIEYLAHFHGDRDYFECHEILEEYWKEADPGNKESIWVALILLAVSCYHHRRNNFSGASRTLKKAYSIFKKQELGCERLGLDYNRLHEQVDSLLEKIRLRQSYTSVNLPIADQTLVALCKNKCETKGFQWLKESNMADPELINRHAVRDRSNVISARLQALEERNNE